MARGRAQFTGTAGEFYVAFGLAVREINASLTLGNAPSVDILASSSDGRRTLSLQVKTSRYAHRPMRYGHEVHEWDVGASAIDNHAEGFWYAFVDLRERDDSWNPQVFFVPSLWVASFVKPDFSRKMYLLRSSANNLCLERWDLVRAYLIGCQAAAQWATTYPDEAKWPESA